MQFITITNVIVALTVGFSIFAMDKPELKYKYIFHPYSVFHFKQHYRFLSHAFLHADYMHLAFNMYALWIFGPTVEKAIYPVLLGSYDAPNYKLGSLCYIILYTGGIYASSIFDYFKNRNNQEYSSLGASGAINAVIFAYILCLPVSNIRLFFMPPWLFGLVYLGFTFYLSKRKTAGAVDNIAHDAHFWGAVFGIVFTGLLKPALFIEFFSKIIS